MHRGDAPAAAVAANVRSLRQAVIDLIPIGPRSPSPLNASL